MDKNHLWNKAKAIRFQTGPEIVGGFDVGFDPKVPAETLDRILDFIYWVEDHFELPITLWVDLKFKKYLLGDDRIRADYKFYCVEFTDYPNFTNPDDIPVIELAVNRPVADILFSLTEAISRYYAWLTKTPISNNEPAEILQEYFSKEQEIMVNNGLKITIPAGATCKLYSGILKTWSIAAIEEQTPIAPTEITQQQETTSYFYAAPEAGLYQAIVSQEGYNTLCQEINYTTGAELTLTLDKLAGNGYEGGFVFMNTPEFVEKCLASHKDAWGPEYAKLFCTPQFMPGRPGRHQQTTNEELEAFIAKLAADNKNIYIYSLGKSPKYGYNIPLVLFTRDDVAGLTLEQAAQKIRANGKPTIQYNAQCHSTEPASCEGALAMMVSLCGEYGKVLNDVDIYFIPRINVDGAFEVKRESPTTGKDMNRDYLYMSNVELRMITAAYNLFRPEVCIDGHERFPYVRTTGDDLCNDIEIQTGAGGLNHPKAMTEMVMRMALSALGRARSLGLRGHFYGKHASAAGGAAGSSYFGTRNSLSFLMETPGQTKHGMHFMERRVMGHYAPASAIIDFTVENRQEIMELVRASRDFMRKTNPIYDEKNLMVIEHDWGKTGSFATPLVHAPTGRVTDPLHTQDYFEHTVALITRPRATAYVIPETVAMDEILRVVKNHDLEYYTLPAGASISLRQYVKTEEGYDMTEEKEVCFGETVYVFPNTADSTILGIIMEPDYNPSNPDRKMTLYRMGLLPEGSDGLLPLYRYCHNLNDGKI